MIGFCGIERLFCRCSSEDSNRQSLGAVGLQTIGRKTKMSSGEKMGSLELANVYYEVWWSLCLQTEGQWEEGVEQEGFDGWHSNRTDSSFRKSRKIIGKLQTTQLGHHSAVPVRDNLWTCQMCSANNSLFFNMFLVLPWCSLFPGVGNVLTTCDCVFSLVLTSLLMLLMTLVIGE